MWLNIRAKKLIFDLSGGKMQSKKFLLLLGSICLILALVVLPLVSAWAAPAPSPPREKKEIVLQSYTQGTSAYVINFALAEMINKHSDWLRAATVESSSNVENIELLKKPENKKMMFAHMVDATFYQSRDGVPPFKEKYTPCVVARENPFAVVMCTLDPKIKTFRDLKGKRVNMLFPGTSTHTIGGAILRMYGIWDTIKAVSGGFDRSKDQLLDGTIDAGSQSLNFLEPVTMTSATEELISMKPTYNVHYPIGEEDEVYAQLAKEKQFVPFRFERVPKAAHPRFQNDWVACVGSLEWICDPQMPDDVVYEFCRILNEYKGEMVNYIPVSKYFTTEGFGDVLVERKYWHPSALKYWDKQGVTIKFKEPKR